MINTPVPPPQGELPILHLAGAHPLVKSFTGGTPWPVRMLHRGTSRWPRLRHLGRDVPPHRPYPLPIWELNRSNNELAREVGVVTALWVETDEIRARGTIQLPEGDPPWAQALRTGLPAGCVIAATGKATVHLRDRGDPEERSYPILTTWEAVGVAVNTLPVWDDCFIRLTGRQFR